LAKAEQAKAKKSNRALHIMVVFLIPIEIGCKDRKNPLMNATRT
jgi:hypothetical protein